MKQIISDRDNGKLDTQIDVPNCTCCSNIQNVSSGEASTSHSTNTKKARKRRVVRVQKESSCGSAKKSSDEEEDEDGDAPESVKKLARMSAAEAILQLRNQSTVGLDNTQQKKSFLPNNTQQVSATRELPVPPGSILQSSAPLCSNTPQATGTPTGSIPVTGTRRVTQVPSASGNNMQSAAPQSNTLQATPTGNYVMPMTGTPPVTKVPTVPPGNPIQSAAPNSNTLQATPMDNYIMPMTATPPVTQVPTALPGNNIQSAAPQSNTLQVTPTGNYMMPMTGTPPVTQVPTVPPGNNIQSAGSQCSVLQATPTGNYIPSGNAILSAALPYKMFQAGTASVNIQQMMSGSTTDNTQDSGDYCSGWIEDENETANIISGAHNTLYSNQYYDYSSTGNGPSNSTDGGNSMQCHSCCSLLQQLIAKQEDISNQLKELSRKYKALKNRNAGQENDERDELIIQGQSVAAIRQAVMQENTLTDAAQKAMTMVFTANEILTCSLKGKDKKGKKPGLEEDRRLLVEKILQDRFPSETIDAIQNKLRSRMKMIRRANCVVKGKETEKSALQSASSA